MPQPSRLSRHDLVWLIRRLPREVAALLKKYPGQVFVAGGYVRSCIGNEPVNDIDLFVGSPAEGSRLALELAGNDETKLHRTVNAITIRALRGPAIQIITRWTFATPAECIASFDFTIASASFWYSTDGWISECHPDFYADLAGRRLVYLSPVREEEAGGSFLRLLKFYGRGYRVPLDSAGAIIARLVRAVRDIDGGRMQDETWLAKVLTGLLREVDPSIDPAHLAHLPSLADEADEEIAL